MTLIDAPLDRTIRVYAKFSFAGEHLNRFTYLADTTNLTTTNLLSFLVAFDSSVLAPVSQIQVSALVWTTHQAEVIGGSKAFAELSLPRGGALSSDGLGPNIVYTFRLLRPSSGVRGGLKRFSGIPENYVSNGSFSLAAPPQALVDAINVALASNITAAGVVYTPIVLVTTFNGQPLPTPRYYIPLGAQLLRRLGTQNTRKV